jgi:thiosulfate/3-mercaptopyruvate sulfurtransferase
MSHYDHMLVSAHELQDRLRDPRLRVFDATTYLDRTPAGLRARSGRSDYEAAHIPGAGFLDITDLSDPDSPLPFTRPPASQLERVLSSAGVSNDHHVVVYSRTHVMWATRAWWILRSVGLDSVAVLDGGFDTWQSAGCSLCNERCTYPETVFQARLREEMWATKQDVLQAIEDGSVCTINALPRDVHTGKAGLGYARAGHIKGSLNVPFPALLMPESGVFRSADDLRLHFATTGVLNTARAVTYCGGGIAATLNAFAIVLLGHPSVAVYDGGLDEWSREPELPMETGE